MIELISGIATILAVAGVLANNRKMVVCFYLWLASNAISAGIHLESNLWGLAIRDLIFFMLAIEGIIKWKKKKGV